LARGALAASVSATNHPDGFVRHRYTPPPRHSAVAGGTPLTEAEIEAKVINIIADKIKVEKAEIKRETNFMTDLNADSLDMVELLMAFEEEFGTKIPEGDSEKLQTVGLAIDYIKQRKAAGN
jgi:acyl carrier protein